MICDTVESEGENTLFSNLRAVFSLTGGNTSPSIIDESPLAGQGGGNSTLHRRYDGLQKVSLSHHESTFDKLDSSR